MTASEIAASHLQRIDKNQDGRVAPLEVLIYLLVPLGLFLGILGVVMTLA